MASQKSVTLGKTVLVTYFVKILLLIIILCVEDETLRVRNIPLDARLLIFTLATNPVLSSQMYEHSKGSNHFYILISYAVFSTIK